MNDGMFYASTIPLARASRLLSSMRGGFGNNRDMILKDAWVVVSYVLRLHAGRDVDETSVAFAAPSPEDEEALCHTLHEFGVACQQDADPDVQLMGNDIVDLYDKLFGPGKARDFIVSVLKAFYTLFSKVWNPRHDDPPSA